MRSRRLAAAAVVLLAVPLAAGCASEDQEMTAAEAILEAHPDDEMPEGDFGPFNPDRVCSSLDQAAADEHTPDDLVELELKDKIARDEAGLLESVRVVCPEYLDDAERVAGV